MKLNPDVVRSILLFIEENLDYEDSDSDFPNKHEEYVCGQIVTNEYFSKYKPSEVSYALELLIKENYISTIGKPIYNDGNLEFARINGLTWNGHEFLDNVRGDTYWEITKKKASKFGSVSLSVLASGAKALATAFMTDPNAFNNLIQGFENLIGMI